jgi:2-hydroxychromene-2-carboxylate isomerase
VPTGEHAPTLQIFYGISSPWAYFGAQKAVEIARANNAAVRLRPIRIIEANGGIPLRSRPDARQLYHEVELGRWREYLDMPLNLKPKFYPCRTIEPAAQAIIALQNAGLDAISFSFGVQRALWAEDRDIANLDTLRAIAQATVGQVAAALIVEPQPEAIIEEWHGNLAEAERLGIFGTPTYVVGEELFWGQDRLDFVDRALKALNPDRENLKETA